MACKRIGSADALRGQPERDTLWGGVAGTATLNRL